MESLCVQIGEDKNYLILVTNVIKVSDYLDPLFCAMESCCTEIRISKISTPHFLFCFCVLLEDNRVEQILHYNPNLEG